jgi:hypothetical protein
VNIPGTTKVKTVRTVFPEITSRAPDNELLWLGCMKGIEERGVSGFLYPRADVVRELRDVKLNARRAE